MIWFITFNFLIGPVFNFFLSLFLACVFFIIIINLLCPAAASAQHLRKKKYYTQFIFKEN